MYCVKQRTAHCLVARMGLWVRFFLSRSFTAYIWNHPSCNIILCCTEWIPPVCDTVSSGSQSVCYLNTPGTYIFLVINTSLTSSFKTEPYSTEVVQVRMLVSCSSVLVTRWKVQWRYEKITDMELIPSTSSRHLAFAQDTLLFINQIIFTWPLPAAHHAVVIAHTCCLAGQLWHFISTNTITVSLNTVGHQLLCWLRI